MALTGEGVLLRIFIGEADRHHGRPLSEVIVEAARKRGLAGATAWKGFMGFGAHSRMHTAKVLRLSTDLPVIIEIVDTREKIDAFLPELEALVGRRAGDARTGRHPNLPGTGDTPRVARVSSMAQAFRPATSLAFTSVAQAPRPAGGVRWANC